MMKMTIIVTHWPIFLVLRLDILLLCLFMSVGGHKLAVVMSGTKNESKCLPFSH